MKKRGYYEYGNGVYPRSLWVHIGKDLADIACSEFEGVDVPEKEYYGVTYEEVTRKSDGKFGILVSFQSPSDITASVCAHESSHVCDYIEEACGIVHGGEASAYLLGWIAGCIAKAKRREGKFIEIKG